jgi:hypothetical protein
MGSKEEGLLKILSEQDKPITVSEVVKRPVNRSVFQRQDAHPVVLDMLLLDKFGAEWLTWEPETIWSEIKAEFGVLPSTHVSNKVNAVKTLHVVDSPWTEWEVFNVIVEALVGNIPDFRRLQRPSPSDLIPAVHIMNRVKHKDFSEEVGRFVAACFLDASVLYLPPPVDFAQPYAEMPRYRCTKCGNIDTDEENDMCDSCGAPQEALEKTATNDPSSVKRRYDEVKAAGDNRSFYLMENTDDIQVAKLLVAEGAHRKMEVLMQKQLEEIR